MITPGLRRCYLDLFVLMMLIDKEIHKVLYGFLVVYAIFLCKYLIINTLLMIIFLRCTNSSPEIRLKTCDYY